MQIKQRIKKLEQKTSVNDGFCRCGTPYYSSFVIGGENILITVCPDCRRDVKPQTISEFMKESHRYEYEVIEPQINESETI